jgi:hypothetical protein
MGFRWEDRAMLSREDAVAIAKERFSALGAPEEPETHLPFDRAVGVVDRDMGRVIVLPVVRPIDIERPTPDSLAEGAVIAAISVEYSPPQSPLRDGIYDIKILRDRGTWIAQFIRDRQIVHVTTDIRIADTDIDVGQPAALAFDFGFVPIVVVVKLKPGQVAAGVVIGMLLRRR